MHACMYVLYVRTYEKGHGEQYVHLVVVIILSISRGGAVTSQAMFSMPPTPSPPPMSSTVLRPASVARPNCFRNLLLSVVAAGFQNAGRTGKPRKITCSVCMYGGNERCI
jgi:hypothetical protein